ncbi:MAG: hypothetical protein K6A44_04920 [bacterium]|nr:hypothetical protein [bacterium]
MRVRFLLVLMFLFICNYSLAEDYAMQNSHNITRLQQYRSKAKLYVPNFVLIGKEASFRVFTGANEKVKVVMDYGSYIDKQVYEATANENGVAVFTAKILDDEDLVGKSVAIDAYILDERNNIIGQAVMQTENGTPSASNRVYIADKDSSKGVLFTPWQSLNTVIMNYNYDERSGYDPSTDRMYYDKTPAYIKNMRDAQDNVR